jgi:hypothetical protein
LFFWGDNWNRRFFGNWKNLATLIQTSEEEDEEDGIDGSLEIERTWQH